MQFHETLLNNGLQVIAESSPSVHSVALGFFVRTGSRDETSAVSGVSHFLEHMVFKGTERHSADDVNRVFDEVGAKYNASTSEEQTLFYAAVLPEYLPRAFDLLGDILFPALRQSDFDMEKKVILEEIGMYDDQPSFTLYEKAMQAHFAGHPLGQSILGTTDSISALTSEQMRTYHAERYRAGNIVLAVAGRFEWPEVLEYARRMCEAWPAGSPPRLCDEAAPRGGLMLQHRPTSQQQHVMLMAPAPSAADDRRFAAELMSVIVGDDTGSRMYWDLVHPGHAEAAELGYNEFDGSGLYLTYFTGNPPDTTANLERVRSIFRQVNARGITAEELAQAKSKVAARIVLRSERPMGRLGALGHNWLYRNEYRSVQDDLDSVRNVTADQIQQLLAAYPLTDLTISTIGPLETLPGA